jgi:hypothetical protein
VTQCINSRKNLFISGALREKTSGIIFLRGIGSIELHTYKNALYGEYGLKKAESIQEGL